MRHLLLILTLIVFFVMLPVGSVLALQQNNRCTIGATDTFAGNFYSACQTLVIDGTVQGDVVALAGTVIINGTVDGDVIVIAGQVIVNGTLHGDVRSLAANLDIQPNAKLSAPHADVAALGATVHLAAPISGDVLFWGQQMVIDNTVAGNLNFNGGALRINGAISGDAEISVGARNAFRPPDFPGLGLTFIEPGLALNSPDDSVPSIGGNLRLQTSDLLNVPTGQLAAMLTCNPARRLALRSPGKF
jgi:cytoskeletal protein CcmA (bactofilin family)